MKANSDHSLLRGLRVVVTGGTRGIGREIVKSFALAGARVAFCSRNRKELSETAREFGAAAAEIVATKCDVSSASEVNRFFAKVGEKFGGVDVVIHNAGIGRFGSISESTKGEQPKAIGINDWRDVIDINLSGAFYVFQAALKQMKSNTGRLRGYFLTIGSLSHRTYVEGNAAYAAAKAGEKVLADYLFEECRRKKILSSYLAVGSVDTTFSNRTPDIKKIKIRPGEVADTVAMFTQFAFGSKNGCVSYAELRMRKPRKARGWKE